MHNLNQRSPKEKRDTAGEKSWWQPGLVLFGRLSSWIVGPVILAIVVGKWLDRKYDTKPWLFLSTVGLAFVLSMFGIVKEGLKAMKKAEEDYKDNNKKD